MKKSIFANIPLILLDLALGSVFRTVPSFAVKLLMFSKAK